MENKREKDGTGSVNDGSRIERSSINASNFFSDLSNDDAASTRNSIATSLAEVEGGEEIYIAFVLDHPSRRDRSPDSFNFADPVPALTSITPVF